MKVYLKNDRGMIKECDTGFSWPVFFLSVTIPTIKEDWKGVIRMMIVLFVAEIVAGLIIPVLGVWIGALACNIYFGLKYNKQYIESLLNQGYYPATAEDQRIIEEL